MQSKQYIQRTSGFYGKLILILITLLAISCKAEKAKSIKISSAYKPRELLNNDITNGSVIYEQNGKLYSLPLLHTSVEVRLAGLLSRVNLEQVFVNSSTDPLEVEYIFPLGERGAVDSMTMLTPDRIIKGVVKKREDAEKEYQQAKLQGKRASILHQERDNIFRQKVANIMPGDTIRIQLSYLEELDFDLNTLRYKFPMTVGPYFNPSIPKSSNNDDNNHNTKDAVADRENITPDYITPIHRDAAKISLKLFIKNNDAINRIKSPSHRIDISGLNKKWIEIKLNKSDAIPNKDFMLEIPYTNSKVFSDLSFEASKGELFWNLVLFPPTEMKENQSSKDFPKEFIFVIDRSGSMRGKPMEQCKKIMFNLLDKLGTEDRFNIISFAGDANSLSEVGVPVNENYLNQAKEFVRNFSGGGGTQMISAFEKVFKPEVNKTDKQREQIVFLMTDGYIGYEEQLIAMTKRQRGHKRVFSLGVGSSPNSSLLRGMAEAGDGYFTSVRYDGDVEKVTEEFLSRVKAPTLRNIKIKGNGIKLSDVFPAVIPSLSANRPLQLTGKIPVNLTHKIITKIFDSSKSISLSGDLDDGGKWDQTVSLDDGNRVNIGLAALWARKKVNNLKTHRTSLDKNNRKEIEKLGVKYQIMTPYTSFLAIESLTVNPTAYQKRINQASQLPDGVDPYSSGARVISNNNAPHINSGVAYSLMGNSGFKKEKKMVRKDRGKVLKIVSGLQTTGVTKLSGRRGSVMGGSGGSGVFNDGYAEGSSNGIGLQLFGLLGSGSGSGSLSTKAGGKVKPPSSKEIVITSGTTRSTSEIMRIIRSRIPGLRHVYNKHLKSKPGFSGKIVLKITIAPSGHINAISIVSSTTSNIDFDNAIKTQVKRWRWKKIKSGNTTFTIPITFHE